VEFSPYFGNKCPVGRIIDPEKAVVLHQHPADAGDAGAKYHLGDCYQNRVGVLKDIVLAFSIPASY
jgi:TPR repeat protein